MKTTSPYHLLTFFVLLGTMTPLQATHYGGGDITYEYLGGCTYRLYANILTDCPLYHDSISNNLFQWTVPPGCVAPVPTPQFANGFWQLINWIEVTPICPSIPTKCDISNAMVTGTSSSLLYMDFDFCNVACSIGDFEIGFQTCCRPYSLVSGGSGDGIYFRSILAYDSLQGNSSPVFNSRSEIWVSNTFGGIGDLSATDPDGDSLVYQLVACQDDPITNIGYNFGYSPTSPLGTSTTYSLDPETGLLMIAPGLSIGPFSLCVEVSQYERGTGKYLGSISRDIEVLAPGLPGGANTLPVFSGLSAIDSSQLDGSDHFLICPGDTLNFDFTFTDFDLADSLFLSANIELPFLGGSLTTNGINPATASLQWAPDLSHLGHTYPIYLHAEDNACYAPGDAFKIIYVTVEAVCLSGAVTHTLCNASTGSIDLTASGPNAPFTYLWSNGVTTEDISALPVGKYWVDVSDAAGNVRADTFYVSADDILLNASLVQPDCNGPNGSISLAPSGGQAPYSFQWSNGQGGATNTGLPAGGYSVVVTDVNGCLHQDVFILDQPDSCYVSIEGTVFYDSNQNCQQDAGEPGIPYIAVDVSPGGATYTDANGHYKLIVDTGQYIVKTVWLPFYTPQICPAGGDTLYFADYDSDTTGINFSIDSLDIQDLRLKLHSSNAKPGAQRYHYATVFNESSVPMDGMLTVKYDSLETFVSTPDSLFAHDPVKRELKYQFSQVAAGGLTQFNYKTLVDTTAQQDSLIRGYGHVVPIVGDTTAYNNIDSVAKTILAPFDPNDKQVEPAGLGTPGYILASQNELEYTVRFQNVGNAPATYVVIRDTLDPNLDGLTYRPASFSHPYTLDLANDSILVFTFANINLPDSASDPLGSQGHVSFSLLHRDTLSPGKTIENRAAIYFDFNPPVLTNTTVNTIFAQAKVGLDVVDSLCVGEELTAKMKGTGIPPFDYEWTNGDQGQDSVGLFSTTADSSGWYQIRVTDAYGFETVDSLQLAVMQEPVADFIWEYAGASNTFIVQFTNLSQNGSSYQWDFGDGSGISTEFEPEYTYPHTSAYNVSLIVTNLCGSDTLEILVWIIPIEDERFAQSVQIIPNPFREQTAIHFDNAGSQAYKLTLYDVQGKALRRFENIRTETLLIERGDLGPGLYLFTLEGPHQFAGKLMIR